MPPFVRTWSGREIRALREAKRMSIRAFASHIGVHERMVSKWEAAGETIHPRPANQAALDSSLAASSAEVQARFASLLEATDKGARSGSAIVDIARATEPLPGDDHHVRHPIDGKLMAFIPAGTFLSGTSNEPVYLAAYYCDIYPTTNSDYARFTAATGHRAPQHWMRESGPLPELADHPVTFVTWHDATAYSVWAAKALPSALQWEKAARGPHGDVYPWGNQLTPAKCNVRETMIGATTPVSRYHSGTSPYGIYDLCGNTWEWLNTPTTPGRQELKGSAFTSPFRRATPSAFNDADADMLDDDTGFRCVVPAETMRSLINVLTQPADT
ncbi:SUMF1/EgtB/PvdO family nonheme iron enzyme [Nonomuraea sp. NPDC003754]